jgi:hypothetical protein
VEDNYISKDIILYIYQENPIPTASEEHYFHRWKDTIILFGGYDRHNKAVFTVKFNIPEVKIDYCEKLGNTRSEFAISNYGNYVYIFAVKNIKCSDLV